MGAPEQAAQAVAQLREQLQALEVLLGREETALVRARWMLDELEER